MTTTVHTIIVQVDWNENKNSPSLMALQGEEGCVAFYDEILAALGIHRPEPFVPPFKVGDIIAERDSKIAWIVSHVSEHYARLAHPVTNNDAGPTVWGTLVANFVKIGVRT